MGLKSLLTDLSKGEPYGETFPLTSTPATIGNGANTAGFNYGQSLSIFDGNVGEPNRNPFFPFKQRSMGYGPQGTDVQTFVVGRANSPNPFIKQRLPGVEEERSSGLMDVLNDVSDSFVRGGLGTALKRSVTDAQRIGEYLLSANGLAFIAKNVGLQRSNPKLQEGAGFLGRNRVYNLGINTVAQTLANFSGLHITRQGALPIGRANYKVEQGYRVNTDNDTKYEYNVKGEDNTFATGGTGDITDSLNVYEANRLTSLYNRLLRPTSLDNGADSGTLDIDLGGTGLTGRNKDKPFETELYEFGGGPHSIYGIGKTRLQRYTSTNLASFIFNPSKIEFLVSVDETPYYLSRHMGGIHGGTDPDSGDNLNEKPATPLSPIIDFRKYTGKQGYSKYTRKNSANQTLLTQYGYPGAVPQMNAGPGVNSTLGVFPRVPIKLDGSINLKAPNIYKDQINNLDLIYHKGNLDENKLPNGQPFPKDYIKFRIEAVDTDRPTNSQTMVFRAFLESMNDDYNSTWNEYNYNGRSESFYTYAKFNRSISFDFKIAAFSREEMRPLYRKLNYLVSTTAGDYRNTRLRGNFMRITVGDYFSRIPGFFTKISLSWNKDYPWEVANTIDDTDMNELPHALDVSCTYQPVHDFTPRKSHEAHFILPTKYTKPNITPEQEWTRELPLYLADDETNHKFVDFYESRNRGYKNRLQPEMDTFSARKVGMDLEEIESDTSVQQDRNQTDLEQTLSFAAQEPKDAGAPPEVYESGDPVLIAQWLKNNT